MSFRVAHISFMGCCALLCAMAAFAEERSYDQTITIPPKDAGDLQKGADDELKHLVQGMRKETLEKNRRRIEDRALDASKERIQRGKVVVDCGPGGIYISATSINLDASGKPSQFTSLSGSQETIVGSLGNAPARISAAGADSTFKTPGYKLALAGWEVIPRSEIAESHPDGEATVSTIVEGCYRVIARTGAKDGRLIGLVSYIVGAGKKPYFTADVRGYDSEGRPAHIEIRLLDIPTQDIRQSEEYRLIGVRPSQKRDANDLLHIGEKVIDERLGADPAKEVAYTWAGRLVSIAELRAMASQQRGETGSFRRIVALGLGLAAIAGFLLLSKRRRTP